LDFGGAGSTSLDECAPTQHVVRAVEIVFGVGGRVIGIAERSSSNSAAREMVGAVHNLVDKVGRDVGNASERAALGSCGARDA
jgi:hypothetical protein